MPNSGSGRATVASNKIYGHMGRCNVTGVVFLDLKMAFNTFDHAILLFELAMYSHGSKCTIVTS